MTPTLRLPATLRNTARLVHRWCVLHHGIESLLLAATSAVLAAYEYRAGHVVFAAVLLLAALYCVVATFARLFTAAAELYEAGLQRRLRAAGERMGFIVVEVPTIVDPYGDTSISSREVN